MELGKARSILESNASRILLALATAGLAVQLRNTFLWTLSRDKQLEDIAPKCKWRRRFVSELTSRLSKYIRECEEEELEYRHTAKALVTCFASADGLQSERRSLTSGERPAHVNARDQGDDFCVSPSVTAVQSAMEAGFITGSDLQRAKMAKLFSIHRMLTASAEPPLLTCTAVRFTIQYNLFAGTIANLGSMDQKVWLQKEVLDKKRLGSFVLTEKGAGVLTGLVVDTLAVWQEGGGFKIHCPTPDAVKNWVCNGLTAQYGVVIARLLLPSTEKNQSFGKRYFGAGLASDQGFGNYLDFGPHAFVVDLTCLESTNSLVRTALPKRTSFNSLDVATLDFQNAVVPSDALLSGLCSVSKSSGDYSLNDPATPFKFEIVAQRLLAGRICISGAALGFLDSVIREVSTYRRVIMSGKGKTTPLVEIPAIADLMLEAKSVLLFLSAYVRLMEKRYAHEKRISSQLVEDIAIAKLVTVEAAIYYTHKLKGAIGSWSLMADSPFGTNVESLYAYKFAEGDTNILVQKVARDVTMRKALSVSNILKYYFNPFSDNETTAYRGALIRLALQMSIKTIGKSSEAKMNHWLRNHRLVKEVAWRHALETIRLGVLREYPEFVKSAELVLFDNFAEVLVVSQL